jgi:hypothetical protein
VGWGGVGWGGVGWGGVGWGGVGWGGVGWGGGDNSTHTPDFMPVHTLLAPLLSPQLPEVA